MIRIKEENIQPRPDDILFQDSPDMGDPECICSRCLKRIEKPCVVRVFVYKGWGGEYRYCDECLVEGL